MTTGPKPAPPPAVGSGVAAGAAPVVDVRAAGWFGAITATVEEPGVSAATTSVSSRSSAFPPSNRTTRSADGSTPTFSTAARETVISTGPGRPAASSGTDASTAATVRPSGSGAAGENPPTASTATVPVERDGYLPCGHAERPEAARDEQDDHRYRRRACQRLPGHRATIPSGSTVR